MSMTPFDKSKIHTTECNHNFHTNCFRNMREPTCPMCRSTVSRLVSLSVMKELAKLQNEEKKEMQLLIEQSEKFDVGVLWEIIQYKKIECIRNDIAKLLIDNAIKKF